MIGVVVVGGKLTGLLKDVFLTYYLGTSYLADAYFISIYVSALFYIGIYSSVPVLILPRLAVIEKGVMECTNDLTRTISALILVSSMLAIGLYFGSGIAVTYLYSSLDGFQYNLVSKFIGFAAITFPASTLAVISNTVRLSQGDKIPTLIVPLTNNVVFIVSMTLWHEEDNFHFVLLAGVFSWLLVFAIFMKPLIIYMNDILRDFVNVRLKDFRTIFQTSSYFYLEQLSPMLNVYFALSCGVGFLSVFSYANKLQLLITSLSLLFITSVIIPKLSRCLIDGDGIEELLQNTLSFTMSLVATFSAVMILYSDVLVQLIFYRGEFSQEDYINVTAVFRVIAIAIPFIIAKDIFARALSINGNESDLFISIVVALLINIMVCLMFIENLTIILVAIGYLSFNVVCFSATLFFLFRRGLIRQKKSMLNTVLPNVASSAFVYIFVTTNYLAIQTEPLARFFIAVLIIFLIRKSVLKWVYKNILDVVKLDAN